MGAESEERQQQVVCSRAGDETGGLGLEERRENEDLKLAYLLHQPPGFFSQVWLECSQEMPSGVGG